MDIYIYYRDKFEIKLGDGTKSKREFGKYITLVEKYSTEFDDFSSGLEINKVGEEKRMHACNENWMNEGKERRMDGPSHRVCASKL